MPPKKRARSAAGRAATATDYAVAEPDYEPAPSKVSLSARQVEIDAALKVTKNTAEMKLLEAEKLKRQEAATVARQLGNTGQAKAKAENTLEVAFTVFNKVQTTYNNTKGNKLFDAMLQAAVEGAKQGFDVKAQVGATALELLWTTETAEEQLEMLRLQDSLLLRYAGIMQLYMVCKKQKTTAEKDVADALTTHHAKQKIRQQLIDDADELQLKLERLQAGVADTTDTTDTAEATDTEATDYDCATLSFD